ncbi:MAG: hypothetical protein GY727_00040 [Gammaproteobacteria bacterium]|nr:hypothetical protein [Gammaproteobacteria bacterium]
MKHKFVKTCSQLIMLAVIVLAVETTLSAAPTHYYLKTEQFVKVMPDTVPVTMWGYAECTDDTFASCGPVTSPGPLLTIAHDSYSLQVHLQNNLLEPTSIVIPGLPIIQPQPEYITDYSGRTRVTSFTRQTSKKVGAVPGLKTYYFQLRPGTYLYHSGTHPQVQVQMGLYGALRRNAGPTNPTSNNQKAYKNKDKNGATYPIEYREDAIILLSEIDTDLHQTVEDNLRLTIAGGKFAGPTSTLDYKPTYYLVNGQPYDASNASNSVTLSHDLVNGRNALLRIINAGLNTHVPVIHNAYMDVVAEDGYPYPYPKEQYSLVMPALKTKDAIVKTTGRLVIQKAKQTGNVLVVAAISDAGPDAGLQVTNIVGSAVATPIDMVWEPLNKKWRATIDLGVDTASEVTVTGLSNRYPFYDRRLALTSAGKAGGGMLTYIDLEAEATLTVTVAP